MTSNLTTDVEVKLIHDGSFAGTGKREGTNTKVPTHNLCSPSLGTPLICKFIIKCAVPGLDNVHPPNPPELNILDNTCCPLE